MPTATRSPLAEQAEKLRRLGQDLTDGRLLEPVLRLAQSGEVWSGPIHDAFLGWLQHGLDFWVRNPLGEGVRLVAKSLADRVVAIEQAQAAMAAGQIGVVGPAAPAPLGYVPPAPPPYGQIGGGPNNQFKTEGMQKLTQLLSQAADGSLDFGRKLRDALVPPPMPLPAPGAPPPISPLPPDAETAAGSPNASSAPANAYLAIATELRNAAADIAKRIDALRILDEPMETTTVDLRGIGVTAGAARAGAEGSADALTDAQRQKAEIAGPRSPEDLEKARREAKEAADDVSKAVSAKDFDEKDHEKLFIALSRAERYADDPEYAQAFVQSLIPDGLAAYCKLMNRSVIDVNREMDILRPLSRLVGTATQGGDQFPPETRKALLNSSCLDTVVHYGTFDKDFALDAARRILKDPDRYERVDGSNRVYWGVDEEGDYTKGDARVGALRLLANNPEAAQEILETHGPDGRRLVFDALEDDGLAGRAAADALEAGLNDLSRSRSEDTLELVIHNTAEGDLDLCGPGKAALARLMSSEQGMARLREATSANISEDADWMTGDAGFNVPIGELESCMGKILDDATARADFLKRFANDSAIQMKRSAETLGSKPIEGNVESALFDLKNSMRLSQELSQVVARGVKDASGEKEANAFLVAGLNLVVGEAVKLVPLGFAGKFVVDKALETAGGEFVDTMVSKEEKERIKRLDHEKLTDELDRSAQYLAQAAMIGDRGLTDQLVPPDSPLRKWDKDGDGRIEMPHPPLAGTRVADDWRDFAKALDFERKRGSPIGRALLEIDDWTETFKTA